MNQLKFSLENLFSDCVIVPEVSIHNFGGKKVVCLSSFPHDIIPSFVFKKLSSLDHISYYVSIDMFNSLRIVVDYCLFLLC